MELVSVRLPHPKRDKPFVLRPLGDIQWTGKRGTTALDLLRRDIDEALAKDAWFVGLGDYIDFASPSNRQRLRAAALYETAEEVIDDKAGELVQELFDLALRPTVGRWLGLIEGHHYAELKSGITTDMLLCEKLKTRHLGSEAVIRLQFQGGKVAPTRRHNLVLHVHHGAGGGQLQGASLNKLEQTAKAWGGIDIFLRGHDTKMPASPINRIYPRWHGKHAPDLIHKTIYLVNTGSYSKSREVGSRVGQVPRGGYAERGGLNANVLGSPLIVVDEAHLYKSKGASWQRAPDRTQSMTASFRVRVQI